MSSQKLKKYLAYYQKTLRDDPGNIEARLRLASIFREMGRPGHAIDEYVTAAKLLASSGLPLEAIAACKAILELDPSHTETQFFLARLFAQVPEATGQLARVARPVDGGRTVRADEEPSQPAAARVHILTPQHARDLEEGKERAITLHSPKSIPAANVLPGIEDIERDDPALSRFIADEDSDVTDTLTADEVPEAFGSPRDVETRVMEAHRQDDLRETVDLDADDIIEDPWDADAVEDVTVTMERPEGLDEPTGVIDEVHDAEQTFELGIFDIASLEIDREPDQGWNGLSFLEEMDESEGSEIGATESSATMRAPSNRAILSVSRSTMPEIPLFSQLTPRAFMELLRVIDVRREPAGTPLLLPDDPTVSLFVIVKGRVRVTKTLFDGRRVDLATMGEGEFFGEFRLLTGRDSLATVIADTEVEVLEIRDEVLYKLTETNPEVWDALWNFYYARMLNNLLASSRMFSVLDAQGREELARRFQLDEFLAGLTIVEQGAPCAGIYLIVSGNVIVEHLIGKKSREIDSLQEGDFFGIVASALDEGSPASVRALSDTIALRLPAEDFRMMMHRHPAIDREVRRIVRERLHRTSQFTAGTTPYAETGVAKKL